MPIVDGLAWEWKCATEIIAEQEAAQAPTAAAAAAGAPGNKNYAYGW
jgi:hypothetical protein